MKRLKTLQSQNQTLSAQLKRLQAALLSSNKCGSGATVAANATSGSGGQSGATSHGAQPATCLMVLMLSLALVMAPNLRHQQNAAVRSMMSATRDINLAEGSEAAAGLHGE
ncbi:hypothetical protein LSTR_LSTR015753 [Laodelphax striatellus]|uniref:Uncharacterized protein n=1 Tax=Laodelphax striatellus TaxID=195883 RepID=A0A482XQQ5_LAOST|nr:hypothetical protein LSTR_LSTR015753 [Laodelphax striatellus]